MVEPATPRRVEIVLDITCVWSFLAYSRFRRAVARYRAEGGEVEVTFRPFQVDPTATPEGEPLMEELRRTFGRDAESNAARFTVMAAQEGVEMRFDRAIYVNTFEAHRLVMLAARQGRAEAMVERLLRAHHTEGLNVGDAATLAQLAGEVGVTTGDGGIAGEVGDDELRAELAMVRHGGVRGVPVFTFDDGRPLTGAQPEETLLAGLTDSVRLTG